MITFVYCAGLQALVAWKRQYCLVENHCPLTQISRWNFCLLKSTTSSLPSGTSTPKTSTASFRFQCALTRRTCTTVCKANEQIVCVLRTKRHLLTLFSQLCSRAVDSCEPMIPDLAAMVAQLNIDNKLSVFVKTARHKFKAMA